MQIKFNNLNAQYLEIKDNLTKSFDKLFSDSSYIGGPMVEEFEKEFSKYIGVKYSIGVSNGTDAIMLAIKGLCLEEPTIIYIPANTFVATIFGAEQALPNARIELIDCNEDYLIDVQKLEQRLKRTRILYKNSIIMPVHLYGKSCDMAKIIDLANKYESYIVEDASQSHGSIILNKKTGSFGHASAFSLYPGKNLGAMGDAGIITTDSEEVFNIIKKLRNLGSQEKYVHELKGFNHRLDSIQAAVLIEKIKKLDSWNKARIKIANYYIDKIKNPKIILPKKSEHIEHVYHIFCIRTNQRDNLISYLKNNNIESGIHYPIPIELMPMYKNLNFNNENTRQFSNQILSLPIHPFMNETEVEYICDILNKF
ncbi:MAG: DegT/DnrJ/EryC1/StrS family aminotransferase [Caulobacteraceae bacterium]|nr:DegT/DnrJ/EryC1/StrS family aminotransferase [Caulobacteraceae bacterium]